MRFWLDKGIDGFRMDAFQFISKDDSFPELPKEIVGNPSEIIKFYGRGPRLHEFIQEMHREVLSKYDVMTVSEGAGASPEEAMLFVDEDRKELSMAYHFEGVDIGAHLNDYGLIRYKELYARWDDYFKEKGWLSIFMANHDQPRMVSKFGNDKPEFREISSKMLSTFVLTMRGTPYYFQGDELAMSNIRFSSINDYNDVDTRNKYIALKNKGGDLNAFIEEKKQTSRENSRTPFQWNSSTNAGFTTGKPWLKINPNFTEVNLEELEKNTNSTVHYFRKLTQLRKSEKVFTYGAFELIDKDNPTIFAYTRTMNEKKVLVVLNFSEKENKFNSYYKINKNKIMLSNYSTPSLNGMLKPYEAVIIDVSEQ